MPPKTAKKGKKADDKGASEEEERRRLEEEARLQEARIKKEKEIQDQRDNELLEQVILQDKERLEQEASNIVELKNKLESDFDRIQNQIESEISWKKFLDCDQLPDPRNEREMNTFISMWEVEPVEKDDDHTLKTFSKILPSIEKLCSNLALAISVAIDRQDEAKRLILQGHLITLRSLIHAKWDVATNALLQHYDQFPVETNENFYYSTSLDLYVLGLWGNLTKNPRHKSIEYSNIPILMSLPKPISLSNVAIRMLYMSSLTAGAPFSVQEKGTPMSVVGGVLYLDLFEMPEPPKILDTWTIRQILSPTGKLKTVDYPFKKTVTEAAEEEKDGAADLNIWPAHVTYEIFPSCFIHQESAKVLSWSAEEQSWSEDNIGDVEIDVEQGQIKFRTTNFRPTALVQNTYSEFPIKNWTLDPIGRNQALLVIKGVGNEISIEINDGKCRLVSPNTSYIDKYIKGEWMSPSLLLMRISQIGLNFFGPKSMKGVDIEGITLKSTKSEDACVIGLGMAMNGFSFRKSPGNMSLSSSKIAVQFKEKRIVPVAPQSEDQAPELEAWRTLVFDSNFKIGEVSQNICFLVEGTAVTDETKFNVSNEKLKLHSSAFHLFENIVSEESNIAGIENSSPMFSQTITDLLRATRLLCFA